MVRAYHWTPGCYAPITGPLGATPLSLGHWVLRPYHWTPGCYAPITGLLMIRPYHWTTGCYAPITRVLGVTPIALEYLVVCPCHWSTGCYAPVTRCSGDGPHDLISVILICGHLLLNLILHKKSLCHCML